MEPLKKEFVKNLLFPNNFLYLPVSLNNPVKEWVYVLLLLL